MLQVTILLASVAGVSISSGNINFVLNHARKVILL